MPYFGGMGWVMMTMILKPLLLACTLGVVVARWRTMPGSGWLMVMLALGTIVEVTAVMLVLLQGYNLWLYDLFIPVEQLLLVGYAWRQWGHHYFRAYLLVVTAVILVVMPFEVYGSILRSEFVGRGFLICATLVLPAYLALLFREAIALDGVLFRSATTWIALGVVIYLGASIPLMGLMNTLNSNDVDLAMRLYRINDVVFALRFGTIIFGVLRFPVMPGDHPSVHAKPITHP